MAFSLPDLGFAHDALEPHIDAKTMEIHHGKHHNPYITNVNAALEGVDLGGQSVDALLADLTVFPPPKNHPRAGRGAEDLSLHANQIGHLKGRIGNPSFHEALYRRRAPDEYDDERQAD